MSYAEEVSGIVVKMTLDGMNYFLGIAGKGAGALASGMWTFTHFGYQKLKDSDKEYVKNLMKSGESIGFYAVPQDKLKEAKRMLKEYKVPYVWVDEKQKGDHILMTGISNATVIEHIYEELGIVPKVKAEGRHAKEYGEPEAATPETKREKPPETGKGEKKEGADLASQMWGSEEGAKPKSDQDRRKPEESRLENSSGNTPPAESSPRETGTASSTQKGSAKDTKGGLETENAKPEKNMQRPPEKLFFPSSRETGEKAGRAERKPSIRAALKGSAVEKAKKMNETARAAREAGKDLGESALDKK